MKYKFFAILCLLIISTAGICLAGDSTSIAPPGITTRSDSHTNGGNAYTEGGRIDSGGGYIFTRGGRIYMNHGDLITEGGFVNTGGGYVDTQGGRVYTRGNHLYTSGGYVYAGGGDLRDVDQVMANRVYAAGSGSWINYYDHIDMNNRVIYEAARVRVNDLTPDSNYDLATKYYVDQQGGGNWSACHWVSTKPYGDFFCNTNEYVAGMRVDTDNGSYEKRIFAFYCCDR